MGCALCDHRRHHGAILWQDDRLAVLLHPDWAVRGHAMVVWKKHVENISDLSPGDVAHFASEYQRAERALLDVTGAARALILKLGIAVPHLHVHIYPVSASASREQVMEIFDARVRDDAGDEERERFIAELRARLLTDR